MTLKYLFNMLLAVFLGLGNLLASSTSSDIAPAQDNSSKLLIIGARPWDSDLQGVKGLEKASFIDLRDSGIPTPPPTNFYKMDVESAAFDDFVKQHKGQFDTIIIDYSTIKFFDNFFLTFINCKHLLKVGGKFLVPAIRAQPTLNSVPVDRSQADKAKGALGSCKFSEIKEHTIDDLPTDPAYDLLRREERKRISDGYTIFIATK